MFYLFILALRHRPSIESSNTVKGCSKTLSNWAESIILGPLSPSLMSFCRPVLQKVCPMFLLKLSQSEFRLYAPMLEVQKKDSSKIRQVLQYPRQLVAIKRPCSPTVSSPFSKTQLFETSFVNRAPVLSEM